MPHPSAPGPIFPRSPRTAILPGESDCPPNASTTAVASVALIAGRTVHATDKKHGSATAIHDALQHGDVESPPGCAERGPRRSDFTDGAPRKHRRARRAKQDADRGPTANAAV